MHAYEILFSPTGGTAKVAAALTTDWPPLKPSISLFHPPIMKIFVWKAIL